MPKSEPPQGFPPRLLRDSDLIQACRDRDFSTIFKMAKRAGLYPALVARRVELTPSAVGEVLRGRREVQDIRVIERVADGLRIPGAMLGLATREWETAGSGTPPARGLDGDAVWGAAGGLAGAVGVNELVDEAVDPEFVTALIEGQLPGHYEGANFFGARHSIPSVVLHAQNITRLLETATGTGRKALLRTGGQVAEFIGWLYQDLGDFRQAALWSDRSMEWAQEAADDHMQSYILFRKSNQATARASAEKAVGLARAAQRLPGLSPQITALAAQQEAQGYALMRNPKAALAKFDEAHALASEAPEADAGKSLDTSYCTPTYIEIQRANCWIDLGEPHRAIKLFEEQLAALPQVYRNDRGVYLARLARAYVKAGELESGAESAIKALGIVSHTGSARTFTELSAVARALDSHRCLPMVATFIERFEIVRDRFAA
ncbi:helix-turn-helix domain-containing protein [Streptomyces sp. HU2014]|uniref:helix-turn-helix domain-containing protein n=1 Tax=Streptomyces sp. HU2014 TaxID=2939414 RepID=UPI00200F267C|nr:helix-turn-helix transcriptional regulator [Streptomyces sp. HU2014]UQI42990.1 helix-turn-helix domain-containing protein [Streptomyces sp. HU2014]